MDLVWVGTDVLFMNKYPKGTRYRFRIKIFAFRVLVKILDRFFICRNWVVSDHLSEELNLKRPTMLIEYPRSSPDYQHLQKYPKAKHEGFNVVYYFPGGRKNPKFFQWLYGWDIYSLIKKHFDHKINWIIVDGSHDMSKIYPVTDFLLRCNRHDGMPMMVRECQANKIPYYWSKENPSIVEAMLQIKTEMEKLK